MCDIVIQFDEDFEACVKVLMDLKIKKPDCFTLSDYQQLDSVQTGNLESHKNPVVHKYTKILKATKKKNLL